MTRKLFFLTFTYFVTIAMRCTSPSNIPSQKSIEFAQNFNLNRQQAADDLAFISQSPHPFGSARQMTVAQYIKDQLTATKNITTSFMQFQVLTPNPKASKSSSTPINDTLELAGINIVARATPLPLKPANDRCSVLLGSHYDTKKIDHEPYLGANDSGSSTIALIQFMQFIANNITKLELKCEIIAVWFDGEESILNSWNDSEISHPSKIIDHTYGSSVFAQKLSLCHANDPTQWCLPQELGGSKIHALVVLDMIGSPKVQITRDSNSSPELTQFMEMVSEKLFADDALISSQVIAIEDDHIPFKKKGIPVLDIIDFNNTEHWHKKSDTVDRISLDSIEKVTKLALTIALNLAS